jgi:hypothetical protein
MDLNRERGGNRGTARVRGHEGGKEWNSFLCLALVGNLKIRARERLAQALITPSRSFFNSSFAPLHILPPLLHDPCPPPLHPYTHASSSFSAVVQLYTCSGQLPTNLSRATCFHSGDLFCHFGCRSLEDAHHIFMHCPRFSNLRDEYSKSLLSDTQRLMSDSDLPPPLSSHLQHTTAHLFQDDSSWPLHSSCFYLGLLPPLLPPTTSSQSLTTKSQ